MEHRNKASKRPHAEISSQEEDLSSVLAAVGSHFMFEDGTIKIRTAKASLPTITYLTSDHQSWIIHVKKFMLPAKEESARAYKHMWQLHPPELGRIVIAGRPCTSHRYAKSFGQSYKFSGQVKKKPKILSSLFFPNYWSFCSFLYTILFAFLSAARLQSEVPSKRFP
jgi:hypothetical protein